MLAAAWRDQSLGDDPFREYVEDVWLPSKHIEPSTRAGYRSNLDQHFSRSSASKRWPDPALDWSRTG